MTQPWMISLHGGHSGDFCLHGEDSLRAMLDTAVTRGFSTFGVTAHAPRSSADFLYEEEIEAGYTPSDLARDFDRYLATCRELIEEYDGRLEVLCGVELEAVPESSYVEEADSLRNLPGVDYVVGSVHHVGGLTIDTSQGDFDRAVAACEGLDSMLVNYYELVGQMVERVRPEVVGHLDLPRLYAEGRSELDSPAVRSAVGGVLEAVKATDGILDLNVGALAKGLATPYPAPWIVELALELDVPFCFGDDSHSKATVGAGVGAGREYLLGLGVETITGLTRSGGDVVRKTVPLR